MDIKEKLNEALEGKEKSSQWDVKRKQEEIEKLKKEIDEINDKKNEQLTVINENKNYLIQLLNSTIKFLKKVGFQVKSDRDLEVGYVVNRNKNERYIRAELSFELVRNFIPLNTWEYKLQEKRGKKIKDKLIRFYNEESFEIESVEVHYFKFGNDDVDRISVKIWKKLNN